jgi:hypothetical protein
MNYLPPRRRRGALWLAVVIAALVLPSIAAATNYWGFNNISSSNPSHGCYYTSSSGIACAQTSASSSQVQKLSGASDGYIAVAFKGCAGLLFNSYTTQTISAFGCTGHDPADGPSCYYWSGGSSYIQCRYFNGFSPTGTVFRP